MCLDDDGDGGASGKPYIAAPYGDELPFLQGLLARQLAGVRPHLGVSASASNILTKLRKLFGKM